MHQSDGESPPWSYDQDPDRERLVSAVISSLRFCDQQVRGGQPSGAGFRAMNVSRRRWRCQRVQLGCGSERLTMPLCKSVAHSRRQGGGHREIDHQVETKTIIRVVSPSVIRRQPDR